MKFLIGSDHIGLDLKNYLIEFLESSNQNVEDLGTYDNKRCDYYEIANKLTKKIINNYANFGILICGTGVGMSIAANRRKGIRAVCCSDIYSAKMSRRHNDSNILCIGSRVIGFENAIEIFKEWYKTPFEGERHLDRVKALDM